MNDMNFNKLVDGMTTSSVYKLLIICIMYIASRVGLVIVPVGYALYQWKQGLPAQEAAWNGFINFLLILVLGVILHIALVNTIKGNIKNGSK